MKLTILGCGGATPRAGGACSGYLVEDGETRLLVDCGSGVLSNLMKVMDFRAVDAIVISHTHADHWFDIVPYRYGIQLSMQPVSRKPLLYLPPGAREALEQVGAVFDPKDPFFGSVFPIQEYDGAGELWVGSLRMTFARTRHVVPTWSIRITNGEGTLAYSADTGPGEDLERFVAGADLFLCEATQQGPGDETPLHLSATQAGQMAAKAGVGMLVLTHVWHELDPAVSVAEAAKFFGAVQAATEMQSWEIAPGKARLER